MRKALLALALIPGLLLASCGTIGGLNSDQINSIIATVQADCVKLCQFLPNVRSVNAIISAFYAPATPIIALIGMVEESICKAPITATAVKRGAVIITRIVQTPKGPIAVTGSRY